MQAKLAATLTILRRTSDSFELLMLRRHQSRSFGGAMVTPGGIFEFADADPRWYSHLGVQSDFQPSTAYSPRIDLTALKITALRETLEETGISFGTGEKIPKNSEEFLDNCMKNNSFPPVHKLKYLTRFIAPEEANVRFDSVNFVCVYEGNEEIVLDTRESSDYNWGTPSHFIKEFNKGSIFLFPPQVYMLILLSQFNDIESLFQYECPRIPLLAQIVDHNEMTVVFPGDYRHKYTSEEIKRSRHRHQIRLKPTLKFIKEPKL